MSGTRAFIELYHLTPYEYAESAEQGGESDHHKPENKRIYIRRKEVFKGVKNAKSKGNDEGEQSLNELRIYIQRILYIAREVVDELKQGA